MVFSSTVFLLYFLPAFLLLYHLVGRKLKNTVILLASLWFYSWGEPWFVFIVLGSTVVDFYLVRSLHQASAPGRRKGLLALSIGLNVGLLLYFKYANFLVENANAVLTAVGITEVSWTRIALPIGISFYTFQTLTYSIDIYRGQAQPLKRVDDYLLYILSFPQMIAGPIVRFNTVAAQIMQRTETLDDKLQGFFRFCIGLGKKVLIANVMGEQADAILDGDLATVSTATAWIGILAYTFQIYFDFSGYSDMAIGLGRIMGFRFPENFNHPYISQSITEFWRRWHITLGAWMRDYLYIPLGGSRVSSPSRLYFNLWFVFLVSGLWHGASWNFVLWGAYHGLFLILDRLFLMKLYARIGRLPSVAITFFLVVIGWVFFRLEDLDQALAFIGVLFGQGAAAGLQETLPPVFLFATLAVAFSFIGLTRPGRYLNDLFYENTQPSGRWFFWMTMLAIALFALSLSAITASGFNPFIYFRF